MSQRLYEVPSVDLDLADHYETIHKEQPAAAERMLLGYHDPTEQLRMWPLSGRVFETAAPDFGGIRIGKLASPFRADQVFYAPENDGIRVLAVIHAAVGEERRLKFLSNRTRDEGNRSAT